MLMLMLMLILILMLMLMLMLLLMMMLILILILMLLLLLLVMLLLMLLMLFPGGSCRRPEVPGEVVRAIVPVLYLGDPRGGRHSVGSDHDFPGLRRDPLSMRSRGYSAPWHGRALRIIC